MRNRLERFQLVRQLLALGIRGEVFAGALKV